MYEEARARATALQADLARCADGHSSACIVQSQTHHVLHDACAAGVHAEHAARPILPIAPNTSTHDVLHEACVRVMS